MYINEKSRFQYKYKNLKNIQIKYNNSVSLVVYTAKAWDFFLLLVGVHRKFFQLLNLGFKRSYKNVIIITFFKNNNIDAYNFGNCLFRTVICPKVQQINFFLII